MKRKTNMRKLICRAREIWRQSPEHGAVVKRCQHPEKKHLYYCEYCVVKGNHSLHEKIYVDHSPAIGKEPGDNEFVNFGYWLEKLFWGKQYGICYECHKMKSKQERQKTKDDRLNFKRSSSFCHHDDSSWCTEKCPRKRRIK